MSKKYFDKESISELFFDEVEEKKVVNQEEVPKDLKHLVFGAIEEVYELISMIKDQIIEGHFETDDQKTSLFDSAAKLIDNLNRTISTLIRRENNLMQDNRERKKINIAEQNMQIAAKAAGFELPSPGGHPAIENNKTFYVGKLSDLVNEIKSVENNPVIDINQ